MKMKSNYCLAVVLGTASILTAAPSFAEDFQIIAPSEMSLEIVGGIVTARLSPDGCVAGFEAACSATRQRAEYQSSTGYGHSERVSYRWEINVADDNVINASENHLYATRFLAGDKAVLQFIVGNDYGYEVNRKTCFGPEEFGTWHTIEVRVVWDSTKKKKLSDKTPGEVHVSCDGVEVYSKSGRPNIKEGDLVNFALGLESTLKLAEGDQFSASYRNIEIGSW